MTDAAIDDSRTKGQTGRRVVALVSCVKTKRREACAAKDLYTSPLFRKMRAYAETHADEWWVLSAKHGLLHPDDVIAPYEETLNNKKVAERRVWAARVYEQMRERGLLREGNEFLWLAGERYKADVSTLLGAKRQSDPLKGLNFGERLRWLKRYA